MTLIVLSNREVRVSDHSSVCIYLFNHVSPPVTMTLTLLHDSLMSVHYPVLVIPCSPVPELPIPLIRSQPFSPLTSENLPTPETL